MSALGDLIRVVGGIIFSVALLWGFFGSLAIISKAAGFWGIVVAFILGPLAVIAAPLYEGFAWGNWFPLVFNYGGGIAGIALIGIGGALRGK